jgi:hypothetical protein
VHEKLRSSGGLAAVERELAESQVLAAQRLVQLASTSEGLAIDGGTFGPPSPQVRGAFQVKVDVEKQFPEGPTLRVVASQEFKLTRIDYLDEHNVKLFSEPVDLAGENLEVPVNSRELTEIWNRTGRGFHIKFRLNLLVDGKPVLFIHPAFVEQQTKHVDGALNFYMHLLG